MEIIKIGLELILKILDIFGLSKNEKEKYEQEIKKATSDYEQTVSDSANVRQSHQANKSKLREAWEKRWGNKNQT